MAGSGLRPTIPSAHAREPQHGSISSTAAATRRIFQRDSTALIGCYHWRAVAEGIRRQDCKPQPSGIAPWIECHQSAESQRLPSFAPTVQGLARLTFPSRYAPPPSNEAALAPRYRRQYEHLQPRRREGGPARQCILSKWPEHCELPPFAHSEDTPKTFFRGRWLESAHRAPTSSSCNPSGSRGKAPGARREPTLESVPPRRPAVPAGNRQRATH